MWRILIVRFFNVDKIRNESMGFTYRWRRMWLRGWQQSLAVAVAACLAAPVFGNGYADYGAVLDKAFYLLAKGQSQSALDSLNAAESLFAGDAEFETLRAVSYLETADYDKAQVGFRALALQLLPTDAAGIKARVSRIYDALAVARQAEGSVLPLPQSGYSRMDSGQLLNINLNRKMLGLPYVGDVTQWKEFDHDQPATAARSKPVPKPKPWVDTAALNQSQVAQPSAAPASLAVLVQQAKVLLANAQPVQAFALLQPYETQGAGDVSFDYVLGTSAVDAGAADQAIFILSRVLNLQPNHGGARLELARAYYANGDYADSKEQFEAVLAQNPPPKAKALSERYLVAIQDYLDSKLRSLTPFVEGRVGYDSNANGATSVEQPFSGINGVPAAIQGLTLNKESLETSSPFAAYAAGLLYSNQFKPRYFLRAGGQLEGRSNTDASFVNTLAAKAFTRFEYQLGDKLLGAGIDVGRTHVGGDFNNNTVAASVYGGTRLASKWTGNAQLRFATQSYESDQSSKDGNDITLAAGATRYWDGPYRLNASFGGIYQDVDADAAINSKQVYGGQASLNFVAWSSTLFTFSLVGLEARYDAAIVGTDKRVDQSYLLGLGVAKFSSFTPNLKWLFNIDATLTDSTLSLYDSDGIKASVGARYDFR